MPIPDPDPPVAGKRGRARVQLADHDDIAKELRRLHRRVEAGEISAIEAVRQSRILSQLGQVLSASSVEKRLAMVEHEIKRRGR